MYISTGNDVICMVFLRLTGKLILLFLAAALTLSRDPWMVVSQALQYQSWEFRS